MEISVIIPTFRRPAKLRACVAALARQDLAAPYEVLIGIDGIDPDSVAAAREAWAGRDPQHLIIVEGPKAGLAAVRNRLLPRLSGRTLVSLNDDVTFGPTFLTAHADAQREPRATPAIVVGRTPWKVQDPDTLFQRLVRETSMVFFHDRMTPDPDRDWGFRHAWPLNLSVPAAIVRELGGWTVFPATYGFEDDDFAFRAAARFRCPVLYRPQALALHDHAMTPRDYLAREFSLGYAALGFARHSREAALAMFSRDLTTDAEFAYTRELVRQQAGDARRSALGLLATGTLPPTAPDGPHADLWIRALYDQHLPAKRWVWRQGLLASFESRPLDPAPTLEALGVAAA